MQAAVPLARNPVIAFESARFLVRPLVASDATDRWSAWFAPADMREALNMDSRPRTKAVMQAYIAAFDQTSRLLLGAFDKAAGGLLVGIGSFRVDWRLRNVLMNVVIGEAAYRNAGVAFELTGPLTDLFFETLDLQSATASALVTNRAIRLHLKRAGWTHVTTLKSHSRRHSDGAMVDLCLFRLTREEWRAAKRI